MSEKASMPFTLIYSTIGDFRVLYHFCIGSVISGDTEDMLCREEVGIERIVSSSYWYISLIFQDTV